MSGDDPRGLDEWRIDQLGTDMGGNAACTGCHSQFEGDALTAHSHHAPESDGSLCYNCHMPFTTYGIQKAHRSHTVTKPSAEETLSIGRPNVQPMSPRLDALVDGEAPRAMVSDAIAGNHR